MGAPQAGPQFFLKTPSQAFTREIEYSAVGVPPVRQGVPFVRRGVPFATFRYLLEFEITTPYDIFVMMKNILIEWLPAIE